MTMFEIFRYAQNDKVSQSLPNSAQKNKNSPQNPRQAKNKTPTKSPKKPKHHRQTHQNSQNPLPKTPPPKKISPKV